MLYGRQPIGVCHECPCAGSIHRMPSANRLTAMKLSMWTMSVLVVIFLAGVLPGRSGDASAVFRSPATIGLLGLLCVLIVSCCISPRRRSVAFVATHVGVVLTLVGAFVTHVGSIKHDAMVPLFREHALRTLRLDDDTRVQLPFGISATDFTVEHYPTDYNLYRVPTVSPGDPEGTGEAVFLRKLALDEDGSLDIEEVGRLEPDELPVPVAGQSPSLVLDDEHVIQATRTVSLFSVQLILRDGEGEGKERTETLTVNNPVVHRGWRVYLSSYDQQGRRYVILTLRRDPGRLLVASGLWVLVAGVFALCLRRQHGPKSDSPQALADSVRAGGQA